MRSEENGSACKQSKLSCLLCVWHKWKHLDGVELELIEAYRLGVLAGFLQHLQHLLPHLAVPYGLPIAVSLHIPRSMNEHWTLSQLAVQSLGFAVQCPILAVQSPGMQCLSQLAVPSRGLHSNALANGRVSIIATRHSSSNSQILKICYNLTTNSRTLLNQTNCPLLAGCCSIYYFSCLSLPFISTSTDPWGPLALVRPLYLLYCLLLSFSSRIFFAAEAGEQTSGLQTAELRSTKRELGSGSPRREARGPVKQAPRHAKACGL